MCGQRLSSCTDGTDGSLGATTLQYAVEKPGIKRVRIGLLTGSLSRAERRELLDQLARRNKPESNLIEVAKGPKSDSTTPDNSKPVNSKPDDSKPDDSKTADSKTADSKPDGDRLDLLIGTQALLSDDVQFDKLALVIIDEQHKFGVEQRAKMRHDFITALLDSDRHAHSTHNRHDRVW